MADRHHVWEQRQDGLPQPWSTDPIVAGRKFTNVYRVLDPGSQFVFELEHDNPYDTLARLFLYRYTNRPSAWHRVRDRWGHYPTWSDMGPDLISVWQSYRTQGVPVFTDAYVIPPLGPGDKLEKIVTLAATWMSEHAREFMAARTQSDRYHILMSEPGVGPFMAMQILTDWGYTHHVTKDREHGFVMPGPGAVRGGRAIALDCRVVDLIHTLTALLELEGVDLYGRPPSLMDTQNTLCEFSKYVRFMGKDSHPTAYRPAHPGRQPRPVLPANWSTT